MKLDRVTITGADDSVKFADLESLTSRYPFVDWGILFSSNWKGSPRFPSNEWLTGAVMDWPGTPEFKACAHLCGKHVRDIVCRGVNEFAEQEDQVWTGFNRIQLNFHGHFHNAHPNFIKTLLKYPKDYIFQCDGVNEQSCVDANSGGVMAYPLFDRSGGAGVVPVEWPNPWGDYCGYAGGLGPDNLEDQIMKIKDVVGESRIWIDMETRVRSDDNRVLDLEKVEKCLQIAGKFIS